MINSAKEFVDLRTSERPDDYLRAARESAPLEVWFDIVGKYPEMKVGVARNKTVPMQVLEQLAVDVDPRIRVAVAMKNKLSKDLMLTLSKDSDSSVRERIAYNKNASDDVLRLLAQDTVVHVSEAARQQLSLRGV
jgi:hypothetical protein